MTIRDCILCHSEGGELIWRCAPYRLVLVNDFSAYPGYCRLIYNQHITEMSDLAQPIAAQLMNAVLAVEKTLRAVLHPDKINLASLGNQVPHLHWHIIPRWQDDPHFPDPIWATPQRSETARAIRQHELHARLASAMLALEHNSLATIQKR